MANKNKSIPGLGSWFMTPEEAEAEQSRKNREAARRRREKKKAEAEAAAAVLAKDAERRRKNREAARRRRERKKAEAAAAAAAEAEAEAEDNGKNNGENGNASDDKVDHLLPILRVNTTQMSAPRDNTTLYPISRNKSSAGQQAPPVWQQAPQQAPRRGTQAPSGQRRGISIKAPNDYNESASKVGAFVTFCVALTGLIMYDTGVWKQIL